MLVGRERECAALDRVLTNARDGTSTALVLRGGPGVGKTSLLRYVREGAGDKRVLEARGIESESELPFSALAELVHPIIDRLDRIPTRQAAALAGALAIGPATPPDRFAVYAATMSLLAAAADEAPLVVLIDDAHWLDASSREALLFAARRFQVENIALLFVIREGEGTAFDGSGLDELAISGIDREASLALLRAQPTLVCEDVAERLFTATGGNPLALLEIPRVLTAAQRAGSEPIDDPLPVGPSVERAFWCRAQALSDSARMALLVAAASQSGSIQEIAAVFELVGLRADALEPAESVGLVSIQAGRLEFRHPLLRSAVYHGAEAGSRRRVHNAFADALPDERRTGVRAWHLAAAAVGPDEDVALALENAAVNARTRADPVAAAKAFERAAELTPDDEERARRLLEAGRDYGLAGHSPRALKLVVDALARTRDPLLRADLQHVRGRLQTWCGNVIEARDLLLAEAERVAALDPTRAASMALEAVGPCFMAGYCDTALTTARRAQSLAERAQMEPIPASLPLGNALLLCGHGKSALDILLRADAWLGAIDPGAVGHVVYVGIGQGFVWLEQYQQARRLLHRVIDHARAASAPGFLPYALAAQSELDFRTGDWPAAFASASESFRLSEETGQASEGGFSLVCLARIEAAQGREPECRAHVVRSRELMETFGAGSIRTYAGSVLGFLELGFGRSEAALAPLEEVARFVVERGLRDPSVVQWAPDLIEAYVRVGRTTDADRALQTFARQAEQTERTWAFAAAARCRGLLAEDEHFERHFAAALSWHDRTPTPFERARTELCFGERLRRAGRRTDARDRLRAALATFEELDAAPWAERAHAELRASGERAHRRELTSANQLTAQELQVALVVVKGATNREAAAALFLSPKTIEFHLRNIYRKLDIRSRTELAYRLTRNAEIVAA